MKVAYLRNGYNSTRVLLLNSSLMFTFYCGFRSCQCVLCFSFFAVVTKGKTGNT